MFDQLKVHLLVYFFFFNDTATTEIYTAQYTLSLHDALPISSPPHHRPGWPPVCAPSGGPLRRDADGRLLCRGDSLPPRDARVLPATQGQTHARRGGGGQYRRRAEWI